MKVALVGFGSVGRAFADIISKDLKDSSAPSVPDINVVLVADSESVVTSEDGVDLSKVIETKEKTGTVGGEASVMEAVSDTEYDVLVETTPTVLQNAEPAFSYIMCAIDKGAHVVTSNKGPVSMRYTELMDHAKSQGVEVRIEGTVGGAMPIINTARESLAGNEISAVRGILNGTCNFILTRMYEEGLPYEHVLGEAQDMGIAEADPSFDVEGTDTALKCVILSNVLFGGENKADKTLDDVSMTGITEITPEALRLADGSGHVVKLIGEVRRDGIEVAPRLVPKGHDLDVGGTLNVVSFETRLGGEITIRGRGAGGKETASALISDLIALTR